MHPVRPDAPDGRDILEATSLTWTQPTIAWGLRMQLPWWCVFRGSVPGHHASGRSASGHCASGRSCYGIFILDEECQGINLLDAACVFQMQGVKEDGVGTIRAMVPCVQMQMSRHNASRRSCKGTMRPDAAVKAQRVQTQMSRHNVSRRSCQGTICPDVAVNALCVRTQLPWDMPSGQGVSWQSRSGCSTCLTDAECQGNFLPTERVKANVRTTHTMAQDT